MISFPFGSRKNKEEVVLVYDVGSASVGAALVLFSDNAKPKFLYSARSDMLFQDKLNLSRFKKAMLASLGKVSESVAKDGLPHLKFTHSGSIAPKRALCMLSSPWYASQTRTLSIHKDKPHKITKTELADMVEKEVASFKNSPQPNTGKDKNTVIEKRITHILLNGYETDSPYDKEAKDLSFTLYMSVSPEKIVNSISEEIRKNFFVKDLEFTSFTLAVFDVLRNKKNTPEDFLFIDISGELTDVSLIKNGTLLETASFPVGKKTIIRNLSGKHGDSTALAHSLMRTSDESKKQIVKKDSATEKTKDIWVSGFGDTLTQLSEHIALPHTVFFVSDEDVEIFFTNAIKQEQFTQFSMTDEVFEVIPVNSVFLHEQCKFSNNAKRDPFLVLGAISAHRLIS